MTSYRNGSTAGMAGFNPSPSKRGNVTSWSAGAVRRHTKWLYSVDTESLDGHGFAFTLTMRDTPSSADALHALRRAWIMRLTRMGATRVHWVIEWQKRGTPHIHAAVYFREFPAVALATARPDLVTAVLVLDHWVNLTEGYGAQLSGQHWDHISGPLGWLKYLSKHASRGVKHYQRSGHPQGWERTGRLWGHTGEWPVDAPMRFDMPREAYWRYRRLVRSWRVADARVSGDRERLLYARKMLASSDPKLSAVRGVSDWLPESVTLEFIALLIAEGFDIVERTE